MSASGVIGNNNQYTQIIMKQTIDDRVREVIRENEITVKQISDVSGICKETIYKQLQGAYHISVEIVAAIAQIHPRLDTRWILLGGDRFDYDSPLVKERIFNLEERVALLEQKLSYKPAPKRRGRPKKIKNDVTELTENVTELTEQSVTNQ